ncbi:MAG: globin-coupled sensor protein, partial [Haloferacaceae archaeon]
MSSHKIGTEERRRVDGSQLNEQIGIDGDEIEWRKRFTGFGPADAERLEEMEPLLDSIADDVVDEFYDHLQSHAESRAVIGSSSKGVEALKRTQTEYLRDLGAGTYDQSYFDRRARIGKIHDMLDLGPRMYLGAYAIYYRRLLSAIAEDVKRRATEGADPGDKRATDGGAAADADRAAPRGPDSGGFDDPGDEFEPALQAAAIEGGDPVESVEEAVDEVVDRALSTLKLMNLDQQVAMDTYIESYSSRLEKELQRQDRVGEEVKNSVDELRDMSEDLSTSTQEIAEIADEQAEGMQEVAGEVSNLSATVEEIASTADEVEATSSRAEELAATGRESAREAVDVIEEVGDAADEVTEDVERLDDRIDEIDEIVEVINDIADQTNLLALNASIE